jgi:predicted aspartyl protease
MDTITTTYNPQHTFMDTVIGGIKLVSFIGSAFLAAYLISSSLSLNLNFLGSSIPDDALTIVSIPLKYTYFPDVGNVATPHLDTKIVTPTKSIPITFLIDSGAKISALPIKYVEEVGLDTTTAKRIYLRSATDNTTYGYLSEITLDINGTSVTIPIAYAEVIEPLLGTFGFFDRFTVLFENGNQVIIKKKS